MQQLKS